MSKKLKANKPIFMDYFGYDADQKRERLAKKIATRAKLRRAGLAD